MEIQEYIDIVIYTVLVAGIHLVINYKKNIL